MQQDTLYPLEFHVAATPVSLQASTRSRERWKGAVRLQALERIHETGDPIFLDDRPLCLTIYYFAPARMEGDIDNIVKPIADALVRVAFLNDRDVEKIVVQKFEPQVAWEFLNPSEQLAVALDITPPLVYIRVDDDLKWRMSP